MTLIQWDREHPTVGMTSWGEERRGERRQGGEQVGLKEGIANTAQDQIMFWRYWNVMAQ